MRKRENRSRTTDVVLIKRIDSSLNRNKILLLDTLLRIRNTYYTYNVYKSKLVARILFQLAML